MGFIMTTSKLFESVEDDTPLWVGSFNNTTLEIYDRPETGAEELYACPGEGQSLTDAACSLAAFLDSAQPEDYTAEIGTEGEGDEVIVSLGGQPWTSFYIETGEEGQVLSTDMQLDNAELDYLYTTGVLPDPDKFGDVTLDLENPDDDFWEGGSGE